MNITDDINKLIAQQLPAAVGDVLKQRLALCDKLEAGEAARVTQITNLINKNAELVANEEATKKRAFANEQASILLDKRETAVTARELKVELNEFKVTAANEKADAVQAVVLAVFANNRYKYQVEEFGSLPRPNNSTGYGDTVGVSSTKKVEGES